MKKIMTILFLLTICTTCIQAADARQNLTRAMDILDVAMDKFFYSEYEMALRYDSENDTPSGTSSVWEYTVALEATNSVMEALTALKDSEPDLYDNHFSRYRQLMERLYTGLGYYMGTFKYTSYTMNQHEWTVYGVNRASSIGKANVVGDNNKGNVYDDQQWLIRELIRAYRNTGRQEYLDKAEYLTAYVIDGWDCTLDASGKEHGGITWGPGYTSKHSCSNGPFVQPLVWLSELYQGKSDRITFKRIDTSGNRYDVTMTKEEAYLDFAKKVYDYQRQNLLNSSTGVYYDLKGGGGDVTTETVNGIVYRKHAELGTPGGRAYTYNTGTMLSGGADLLRVTNEQKYLTDITALTDAALKNFTTKVTTDGTTYLNFPSDDNHPWFNDVYMRGAIDALAFYEEARTTIDAFQADLDYAYEHHRRNGVMPDDYVKGWVNNGYKAMFTFSCAAQYADLAKCTLSTRIAKNGIVYTLNARKNGYNVTGYYGSLASASIESQIGGLDVTNISPEAFKDCTTMTFANIPASITSIGEYAFQGCTMLSRLLFKNGTRLTLHRQCFQGCSSLRTIALPASLYKCDNNGFFKDCTSLSKVTFAENNQISNLGGYMFEGCTSLSTIDLSPLHLLNELHGTFKNSGLTEFDTPATITDLGNETFYGCSRLTTFSIPATIQRLGESVFRECNALREVTIASPSELAIIESKAFEGCPALESINLEDCDRLTAIGDRALRKNQLSVIRIPRHVTTIGEWAFEQESGNDVSYVQFLQEGGTWPAGISNNAFKGYNVHAYIYKDVEGVPATISPDDLTSTLTLVPVAPIVIEPSGCATYYGNTPIVLPDGIFAGTAREVIDETLVANYLYPAGSVLPAAEAVIIKGSAGTYYPAISPEDTQQPAADNLLRGTEYPTTIHGETGYSYYSLTTATPAFDLAGTGSISFLNAANTAYLALPTPTESAAVQIQLDHVTTAIARSADLAATPAKGVYNLQGQRFHTLPSMPGLYIVNGRKIIRTQP